MGMTTRVRKLPDCKICGVDIPRHEATYDFKTSFGPWGYGCQAAFDKYGIGLGTGLGQELVLTPDESEF